MDGSIATPGDDPISILTLESSRVRLQTFEAPTMTQNVATNDPQQNAEAAPVALLSQINWLNFATNPHSSGICEYRTPDSFKKSVSFYYGC